VDNYWKVLLSLGSSRFKAYIALLKLLTERNDGHQKEKETKKQDGSARKGNKTSKTTARPAVQSKDG